MDRESLIRRMPEIAFTVLFGAGLVLGGAAALAGIPKFVEAAVPGIAAEAAAPDGFAQGVARFGRRVLSVWTQGDTHDGRRVIRTLDAGGVHAFG
jgi:hypothetical protein